MSAYDMTFSDAIYGGTQQQVSRRYVSESRLISMLNHEYGAADRTPCRTARRINYLFLLLQILFRRLITIKQMMAMAGWVFAFNWSQTGRLMMWCCM